MQRLSCKANGSSRKNTVKKVEKKQAYQSRGKTHSPYCGVARTLCGTGPLWGLSYDPSGGSEAEGACPLRVTLLPQFCQARLLIQLLCA